MLTLLQPSSSQDCDSDGEAPKSTKRRISFTPDVPKGKDDAALASAPLSACPALANVFFAMTNSAGSHKENIYSTWNMARCDSTDCCSAGENKEAVRDVGAERESNPCLKRSSEVLLPPSPGAAVVDSNLVARDHLERTSSFEGNPRLREHAKQ